MRRKEFAVSLGLATPGKGRMSREALAAIEEARSKGMTFDDDTEAPKVSTKAPKAASKPTVRAPRDTGPVVDNGQIMADTVLRYPLTQKFKGVDSNGKEHRNIGAASACYNCGYSLCGHTCNAPMALIGSPLEWIAVVPQ